MIKRFYKISKGDDSSDSSSSSGSDSDDHFEEEIQDDEVDGAEEEGEPDIKKDKMRNKRKASSCSPASSGNESEDNWVNETKVNDPGLPMSEDDSVEMEDETLKNIADTKESDEENSDANDSLPNELAEFDDCILRIKSVFKCRICPKVLCLNEEALMAHLNSKKHARSKKKLNEGTLKVMLNSDGKIEEDQETHEERHMRTLSVAQEPVSSKKKDSGRKRQNIRRKRKQLQQLKKKAKEQAEIHEKSSDDPAKNPKKSEVPAKNPKKSEEPDKSPKKAKEQGKHPKKFKEPAKNPKKKQRKNKTEV